MTTTSRTYDNSTFEIPLKLSKILEDSEIIHKFVIDTDEQFVKLRLNSKYNPPVSLDVSLDIIKEKDGWTKFSNKFRDLRKTFKNVSEEHNVWIYSNVNENGSLIRTHFNNNNFNPQQQREQSDEHDEHDETKNTKEDKLIEKISVSQAIRKNSGKIQVTGTITSITPLSKMISKVKLYCDKCSAYSEHSFNPIPVSNTKNIKEKCDFCERLIRSYNIKPLDHKNTVMIELQDTNTFDDLDRLPVFLFDEDTIGIKFGENAEIVGDIKILENNFKYFPYLYCESIKYLNKEDSILTDSDIEKINNFNETHKDKPGGTISALVEIFDPSIVECELEKEGILYCAANTSPKVGDESEHLDILFIGPPGLAKTKLLERGTELVRGSNKVGGQYATGKSFTAIVERRDDNTFLTLGSIPRSSDAICGINELSKLNNQDLDKLYDVMAGRRFDFEKFGIKANIKTPTAIIASANPANSDSWINNEKVDFNELPFLAPLKDRLSLIFIFRKRSQKENDEFADKWSEIEAKKERGELPDYTEFIIKYVQYAKTFEPVLSDDARFMLKEFYKKVNANGFGSPRVFKTLKNLAKAVARLKLKNVVDEQDAKKTMEFYNIMLIKFQKSVVYSESPKILAYKKGVEIIENGKEFGGITLEELFTIICKDNKQLATFFGYDGEKSLKITDNHKVRDVKDLLLNHTNIKTVRDNPITLKWFDSGEDDERDEHDKENCSKQEKNNENFNECELESTSSSSGSSSSEKEKPIKGFQMSPKGRIYEVTDNRYKELKGESEGGEDLI